MIVGEHIGVVGEELNGFAQQLAKVHRVQNLHSFLVRFKQIDALAIREHGVSGGHFVGRQTTVLPAVDMGCQLTGRPALLIDVFGLDDLFEEADLVVGVQNGEA